MFFVDGESERRNGPRELVLAPAVPLSPFLGKRTNKRKIGQQRKRKKYVRQQRKMKVRQEQATEFYNSF